eukprot:PhM_4_TR8238/c1_g1_i2/m.60324
MCDWDFLQQLFINARHVGAHHITGILLMTSLTSSTTTTSNITCTRDGGIEEEVVAEELEEDRPLLVIPHCCVFDILELLYCEKRVRRLKLLLSSPSEENDDGNKTKLCFSLLGPPGCGKSTLVQNASAHISGKGTIVSTPSIGIDFCIVRCSFEGQSNSYKVFVWDHIRGRCFRTSLPHHVKRMDGVIICFDVNDSASLREAVEVWVPLVSDTKKGKPFTLVGCKADRNGRSLCSGGDSVHIAAVLKVPNCVGYFECSAVDGVGIHDAMSALLDSPLITKTDTPPQSSSKPMPNRKKCVLM